MTNFWQTDLIRLRAIEPTDAEIFHRWNQDSDRARHLDFLWPPGSLAAVRTWTEAQSQRNLEKDAYHWLIETLDGTPVGSIDTHHCDTHAGTFSYAIAVATEHRRKGYAREAIRLVLNYYFEELRYQKVTVPVHSDNPDSIAVHEALGFRLEGTFRRMGFHAGQYFDVLYYGLTVEEFHQTYHR